jgi:hypothetical protein
VQWLVGEEASGEKERDEEGESGRLDSVFQHLVGGSSSSSSSSAPAQGADGMHAEEVVELALGPRAAVPGWQTAAGRSGQGVWPLRLDLSATVSKCAADMQALAAEAGVGGSGGGGSGSGGGGSGSSGGGGGSSSGRSSDAAVIVRDPLASLCSSWLMLCPQVAQNGAVGGIGAPAPQGSLRPLEGLPVRARALLEYLCSACGVSQDEALLHVDNLELLLLSYTGRGGRGGGGSGGGGGGGGGKRSSKRARKD